jgi:hypothetical protein
MTSKEFDERWIGRSARKNKYDLNMGVLVTAMTERRAWCAVIPGDHSARMISYYFGAGPRLQPHARVLGRV